MCCIVTVNFDFQNLLGRICYKILSMYVGKTISQSPHTDLNNCQILTLMWILYEMHFSVPQGMNMGVKTLYNYVLYCAHMYLTTTN